MVAFSLTTLAIATLAICINVNAKDEIVQLGAVLVAIICLFLSLIFAPMPIQILVILVFLLNEKRAMNNQWKDKTEPERQSTSDSV